MPKAEALEYEVGNRSVRLSSPDKIYFPGPGYTKRDVFEYYLAVSEPMLRYMRERPTALQRFPEGIDGEMFYQKRVPTRGVPDWITTAEIKFPSGRKADELCPREPGALLWAAQMGTIVFHPWPVRAPETEQPDELRIDLDPQPGTDFTDAVHVAGLAREVLADAGLTGFPKTSGGRGVHVYVRIEPRWSFIDVRHAVIAFARELERRDPDRITTAWWKEERGEKVFIDFNQMARDRTIAAPYSLRANPRATVSTPVSWDELKSVEPDDFDLRTVPVRLAQVGDLYAELDGVAHDLSVLLEWWERDERDRGLGEMPYPPDYPKMPGEPMRVQPSRARDTGE
ncbi:ATP-dependent DNA ligase [Catellatospora sp. TT07R-123]|uniref:non-homologous end-joining DNA ligase n=1 Tax=Catellatospora sp. TT07R-123 TaxID=2733863 RepID=UPI001B180245|nr:non-homologous end-joining DNA ligase [Catellatospora sp. TT07R-123]GHJ49577.1 ATP-dependent DNA ligase [Catellatospora sp. TT07R-123]